MKILVGNNRLMNPGGSETYTYAIVKELVECGHAVTCITSDSSGMVSDKIRELNVPIKFNFSFEKYDVALLSHSTSIKLSENVQAFKIQTCHGVFPKLEQPVKGMDAYVAISEEVQQHLASKGINSTIIRNGIDCSRFKPEILINEKLQNVLSLAHSDNVNEMLVKACKEIGCNLKIRNKYIYPVWDIENWINEADLVVGLGRGAYEAAACGRNVIILDQRNYTNIDIPIGDGFLTKDNFPKFLENNCSGRYSRKPFTVDVLVDEMGKYNYSESYFLRDFVYENLNIKKQVNEYLNLVR